MLGSRSTFAGLMRTSMRHKHRGKTPRRADPKIPVQLLKDFPNFGYKGEVIKVLPSVMRNYLHIGNGACYITAEQGPRIPVVDKSEIRAQQAKLEQERNAKLAQAKQEEQERLKKKEKDTIGALSLNELSSLFDNMKGKKHSKQVQVESTENDQSAFKSSQLAFSSLDIVSTVPETISVSMSNMPEGSFINKHYLADVLYSISGIQIPESAITITKGKEEVTELQEPGTFVMAISVPGERDVVKRSVLLE